MLEEDQISQAERRRIMARVQLAMDVQRRGQPQIGQPEFEQASGPEAAPAQPQEQRSLKALVA